MFAKNETANQDFIMVKLDQWVPFETRPMVYAGNPSMWEVEPKEISKSSLAT